MNDHKKFTVRFRQVGDGLWKASAIDSDGHEETSVTAESAVRAQARLIKEVSRRLPDKAFEVEQSGYMSDSDHDEWRELNARWKKRRDEMERDIRGEQKIFFLRMMRKYGFKADALAKEIGLTPPTVRSRLSDPE